MATYYVDYEGGNDSNDGLSFANRKKTVLATTTAAGTNNTNEIRIMASPEPTLVGDGYITSRPSGNYRLTIGAITYSTTEGETVLTINSHGFTTGDTVNINGNIDANSSRYIDGTWEITVVDTNTFKLDGYTADANTTGSGGYLYNITQRRILLDTAVTQNIASTGQRTTSWTASTNVTTQLHRVTGSYSYQSTNEHGYGDKFIISSSFTTGKAAYWTLPSTLDLSGYQQVSFGFRMESGSTETNAANGYTNFSLRLCTDTTGDTSVNTINVPIIGGTTNGSPWRPITVDLGTNLNSAIKSIALYVDTDKGAQTFYLANIIACKASSSNDSLTLNSLIGLNITTTDTAGGRPANREWYAIESINGRRVLLGIANQRYNYQSTWWNNGQGAWFGDNSGIKSIYKREAIPVECPVNSASTSTTTSKIPFYINTSGNFSSGKTTISGGWNRTDMSTQYTNGMTYYDIGNGRTYGGYLSSKNYLEISNIGVVRATYGLNFSVTYYTTLENIDLISCYDTGLRLQNSIIEKFRNIKFINCSGNSGAMDNGNSNIDDDQGDVTFVGYNRALYNSGNGSITRLRSINLRHGGAQSNYALIYCGAGSLYTDYVDIYPGDSMSGINWGIETWSSGFSGTPFEQYPVFKNLSGSPNHLLRQTRAPGNWVGIATMYVHSALSLNTGSELIIDELDHRMPGPDPYDYNYKLYGTYSPTKYTGRAFAGSTGIIKKNGTGRRFIINHDGQLFLNNYQLEDTTDLINGTSWHGMLCSKNHDGVSGDLYNIIGGSYVVPDTTTRHTASGFSWKITTRNTDIDTIFQIARVPATASSTITFKLWFYRASSNSPLGGLKIYPDGNIDGLTSTVSSSTTSTYGTWEEVSVSVTPQNNCIINVHAFFESTNFSGQHIYIDDFSIS